MAGIAKSFNGHIIKRSNKEVDLNEEKYKRKIFGLYFSSHWCPPRRVFTPLLSESYTEYHRGKRFKIIFISSDSDEKSFNDYYKNMPWLASDLKERRKKKFYQRNLMSMKFQN
ncbi:unnamed protein product [Didymodactylos carnosus]|uniref:protein-disulfide reductase n=1 Tax=Didymodactylos carnosus TaxID=1234261 RepID=A0A814JBD5_9BILA|nr:unnamed protein product [Didymodactylos carnosus]CAF1422544.1 unnamed protein product [Didymodactylos carnosus]CAF3806541.1 unnamed protein product [Didymodactylos carnosus]CAF4222869.1 unnamed protein product [Didymodactylos carnosus]